MTDNGAKEENDEYKPFREAIETPLFERDLLTPSPEIMDAIAQSYFPDENALLTACQYIAWLELFGLTDEIKVALYKINGNRAIQARSLRYAVQAHGGLYWPDNVSKDEKKFLSQQFRQRDRQDDDNGERNGGAPK